MNSFFRIILALLAAMSFTVSAQAQIDWGDGSSTDWNDGTDINIKPGTGTGHVTSIRLSASRLLLSGGETARLVAIVNADAANKKVTWSVVAPAIATVDEYGLVTALTTGQTVVTATADDGGMKAQCVVTVKNNAQVYVERIELQQTDFDMFVGDFLQLHPTVLPENATDKHIVWENKHPDFYNPAFISEDNTISANKPGVAEIRCRPADGSEAELIVRITVKDRPITSLSLPASISLRQNEMRTITPTVSPGLKQMKFKWSTSDPSVAYVNTSGRITGVAPGTTTLTVEALDGTGKKATSRVTVSATKADWGYSGWVLERGQDINPWTARSFNEEEYWNQVPDNDASGHKWYEAAYDDTDWGYTYGPLKQDNNWGSSACAQWEWKDGTSLTIRQKFYLPSVEGYDFDLYVYAGDCGNNIFLNGKHYYLTDNPVISLSRDDLNFGGINILAIHTDPYYNNASLDFGLHYERSISAQRVILTPKSLSMPRFATSKITAMLKPAEVTRPGLRWTSSDESIAIVRQDGTVLSLSPGTATIMATTTDGSNVSGQCVVTVTEKFGEETDLEFLVYGSDKATYRHLPTNEPEPKDAQGNSFRTLSFDDSDWDNCHLPLAFRQSTNYTHAMMEETDHRYYIREHVYIPELSGKYVVFWEAWRHGGCNATFNGKSINDMREIPLECINQNGDNVIAFSYDYQGEGSYFNYRIWFHKIVPVTSVSLNKTTITLDQDVEEHIEAEVLPWDAYNRNLKWTSSAPTIASVNQNGDVRAMGEGTATITATTTDGTNISASCQVTVSNMKYDDVWIKPLGRDQSWTAKYQYCRNGEALYNNGPANDRNGVAWTSPQYDDTSWQSITGPIGHAVSDHYETYWPDNDSRYYLREKFTLSNLSEYSNLRILVRHDDGVKVWMNGRLIRDTNDCIMDDWLDMSGVTLNNGTNTICIQVTEGYGGAYIDYGIVGGKKVVVKPVTAVSISKTSITLKQNQKATLTATVAPADAYYKEVKWETSNPDVVMVDQEGNIRGGIAGTATITVTNTHGKAYSATCQVTVTNEIMPVQPGEWVLPKGDEDIWNAKVVYAPWGHANHDAVPANDANGNPWTSLNYNDDDWQTADGPLNRDFGNWPDDNSRYYVRRKFVAGDLVGINSIRLYIKHDDNALVYINGVFVAECPDWSGGGYREYLLPKGLLSKGQNIVCVNIYQGGGGAELDFGLMGSNDEAPAVADILQNDINAMAKHILDIPQDNFNNTAADVNGDGTISIADIVRSIKAIMGH